MAPQVEGVLRSPDTGQMEVRYPNQHLTLFNIRTVLVASLMSLLSVFACNDTFSVSIFVLLAITVIILKLC